MRRDDKTVGQREKCEEKYQIAQMLQERNRKTDFNNNNNSNSNMDRCHKPQQNFLHVL